MPRMHWYSWCRENGAKKTPGDSTEGPAARIAATIYFEMTSLEAGEKGSLVIMNSWSLDHRSLVRDQEYLRARTGHQILSSVTDEWAERAWIKISTDLDEAVWFLATY